FRFADAVDRQVLLSDPARRRPCAHIGKLVAVGPVGDEVETGVRASADDDAAGVDPFAHPEFGQRLTETIGADSGEIGSVGAEPRGGDHRIRGVAAEALHEGRTLARLIQFDQRLADRQEIRHAHLVATATATPAITPPAARWTMRIARVERKNARARLAASA